PDLARAAKRTLQLQSWLDPGRNGCRGLCRRRRCSVSFGAGGSLLQTDKPDLQIARGAQEIHHLHPLAVRDSPVRANKNAFFSVSLRLRIESAGQTTSVDRCFAERQG